jgi:hypothetical protein
MEQKTRLKDYNKTKTPKKPNFNSRQKIRTKHIRFHKLSTAILNYQLAVLLQKYDKPHPG